MAEDSERPAPQTVVVERGGFGTVLIGLLLLIAVLIGAWFLLSENHNDAKNTDAITTAVDKIGASAEKIANKVAP